MKIKWVIRVVLFRGIDQDELIAGNPLVESLRYAGIIRVHRDDASGMCFDLMPPSPVCIPISNQKVWAERNSERMRTFGINAVVAPVVKGDEEI